MRNLNRAAARELCRGWVGAGWGEHSPTPYFCLLVGIQRAMAATSPRGGGDGGCGGGYSSSDVVRSLVALQGAPGSSAMFRQTSLRLFGLSGLRAASAGT